MPQYKKAWIVALLGFILLALGYVLGAFFWTLLSGAIYGDNDWDSQMDVYQLYSVGSAVAYTVGFIGIVLMVTSIVLVIRGLLVDGDRHRSGAILVGNLKSLEYAAIIALVLYLADVPIRSLLYLSESSSLIALYSTTPGFLFLAALPLIVAHALYKGRSTSPRKIP